MKKTVFVRLISAMLLAAYLLAVLLLMLKNIPEGAVNVQIRSLRAIGFIKDGAYTEYINEYVDYLVFSIPVGFLFPFALGRKSLNGTLIFSVFTLTLMEVVKYHYTGGVIAIDDELWALAGTLIGFGFYSPVCKATGFSGKKTGHEGSSIPRWLGPAILFALMIYCMKTMSDEDLSLSDLISADAGEASENAVNEDDTEKETVSQASQITNNTASMNEPVNEPVYDRLYKELSIYGSSVIFTDDEIAAQDVFDEYTRLIDAHPELFWLTGGAEAETVTRDDDQTLTFKPEFADHPYPLETMASALDSAVKSYVVECPGGSDYDKALWVHDRLIRNTKYDADVLFYARSGTDPHFDYAYTAYGALVRHKAVCAGYARAFQLIMNRFGIECGYISGKAVNSKGETEDHAWNYIKVDDQYYFVDVTWDDPVSEDYTDTAHLSHDYFFLSTEDMGRDHFPDEDQFIPYCPETRSPY